MPVKLGYAKVRITTEKAVMFNTRKYGTMWVPNCAIHNESETWDVDNTSGELVVKTWFAEKEGLI